MTQTKIQIYKQSAISLLLFSLLTTVILLILGVSLADLGLRSPKTLEPLVIYTVALSLTTIGLLVSAKTKSGMTFLKWQLRQAEVLRPYTSEEKRWYLLCAFLGPGICEELIFRGVGVYLLSLINIQGLWAVALIAILFALAHLYKDWRQSLLAGLMGFVLGWVYIASDSLYPAIIAHTLANWQLLVFSGIAISKAKKLTRKASLAK